MSQIVEHGLLVEFALGSVNYNRSIDDISDPVRSAFHIQDNVPISPACHPIVQILKNVLEQKFAGSHVKNCFQA
jgi:hypothetical protein